MYVSDFGGIYNNAVLALYDIGPLGNDVLGGTGIATAANPIWTPNMENQKAGIVFNAANSTVLRSAAFAQEVPQPNTIFFAGTNTADSSSSRCFFTALGTRQDLYVLPPTSLYAGGADFVRGTTPISILVINAVLFNGASSKLWVNGIVDVSGDPGSNALNGITLGANADANGSFLSGPIYEYISLSGDKTELVSTITDSIDSRLGVMESNYTFTPSIIGTFSDTGFLYDMAISGDNLYLLFQSGYLRVIDISDVENPVKIGELAGLMVGANRLSIEGTNAYITCGSVGLNEQLRIVDISDPEDPTIIGGSDFTLGFGIGITSHRVRNGLLYATLTSGAGMNAFRIIDVFDPADIHVAGGESLDIGPLPLGYPQGLDVVFPYAYVTIEDNNDNSFRIIDITDPAAPVVLSTTVDGDMVEARSPLVIGNYCYTLSASYIFGFTVFDVSNKAAPRIRRRIPLDNIAYLPNGLRSIGDGKVIMGSEIREGHLDAFRIVDVSSIYDLKMYTPDVLAYDNGMPSAVAKGNYVFLGFVNGVVQVMDLAASGF